MAWWMPVLAALGVNAGKNILTGQDPLKNAATAGLTGGITGGLLNNTIPGTDVASGATSAAYEIVPGSIESAGMTNVGGTFYNPDYFVGESLGAPLYTGGEGLLSNATDEVKSLLGDIAPENLMGVAGLLNQQDTGQYQQMAGTGGVVSRGSGQGLSVQMPQAKVFKRRKA